MEYLFGFILWLVLVYVRAVLVRSKSHRFFLIGFLLFLPFWGFAQHHENTQVGRDTMRIFNARIEVYPRNAVEIFYQVKVSCILNIHAGKGFDYYQFYEKHLFGLDELARAFALIEERAEACPCRPKSKH